MRTVPYKRSAYKLLHEGSIALAEVEANGIKVDVKYLDGAIADTRAQIASLEAAQRQSDVVATWKKHFREKTNLGSNEQLGKVLFDIMGFECPERTDTGRYKTDEKTLSTIDHPFVAGWLEIKKLEKAVGTFLMGIRNEVMDGYLHAVFNLHLAETFRSSSDSPNFQNLPVRNKQIMKLVRRSIIARKGRRIVEKDYSGVEVGTAACYHKDPAMITYINDKTKDMHRDMAAACYMLKPEQVTKDIRYCGKNKFVFPEFYGSWYPDCAKELWFAIDQMKLSLADGTPLKAHLQRKGITELGACSYREQPVPGTFEHHIQKVEKKFWGQTFPVYAQWKKSTYEEYKQKGWILTKTGFICQGYMKRNEVINYPVQGSAFHLLLWSLIEIMKEIKRRKMKSLVIGQIHDSLVSDVPDEELDEFDAMTDEIMTKKVREHWGWIIVPLETETEITPVGGSWDEKEKRKK